MSNFKLKISPSSIETRKNCPRQWYYRYIEKLYPKVTEDDAPVFGQFVHDVAENFTPTTIDEFKKLVIHTKSKYTIGEDYKNKIIPAIKNLYCFCMKNFDDKDIVLVKEYNIDELYKENFYFKGKIDVLYCKHNTLKIIDYKTSKEKKDYEFQLAFYFYILKKIGMIDVDEITCEIVYLCLEKNDYELEIDTYNLNLDSLKTIEREIEQHIMIYKNLGHNKEKWRKKTGPLCAYCDYYKSNICGGKDKEH